jgi:ariadne-1
METDEYEPNYDNCYTDYNEYDDQNNDYCNDHTLIFEKKLSYKIIKEDEAIQEREALLKQASDRLDMDRDSLILALVYFKWDLDILAERWYDKPEFYSYEAGITQSPLSIKNVSLQKITKENKYCLICYTEFSDLSKEDYYSLSCQHYFCRDCWTEYLSEKLNEINTAIVTSCPQLGCNCIVTEKIYLTTILKGTPQLRNYYKCIMKNFTDFNSVIKPCPYPGCESYVHCEKKGNAEVTCSYCDHTFCFKCIRDGHRPCPCEMINLWEAKNQSESENVKWLQINTKKCPHCHKHIEKNQGCNHMTCRKEASGCGYEFCWICMGDWKNHKSCNKFEGDKEEKQKESLKHELDRYIFYFDRYMNHKKSLKYAVKMKSLTEKNIEKLNTTKMIPYSDLMFLREGVNSVIDSRRVLMNSYVFGFYLKDESKGKKDQNLFEFHQGILEENSDKIHGLLENVQIEALLCIDNLQDFNDNFKTFKNNVIDLYTVTNKFCLNLLSSIENSLIEKIKIIK